MYEDIQQSDPAEYERRMRMDADSRDSRVTSAINNAGGSVLNRERAGMAAVEDMDGNGAAARALRNTQTGGQLKAIVSGLRAARATVPGLNSTASMRRTGTAQAAQPAQPAAPEPVATSPSQNPYDSLTNPNGAGRIDPLTGRPMQNSSTANWSVGSASGAFDSSFGPKPGQKFVMPAYNRGTARIPGHDTGEDTVPAMLRPGEAVLTPGAAEELGREKIADLNAKHAPKTLHAAAGCGKVQHYAGGTPWVVNAAGDVDTTGQGRNAQRLLPNPNAVPGTAVVPAGPAIQAEKIVNPIPSPVEPIPAQAAPQGRAYAAGNWVKNNAPNVAQAVTGDGMVSKGAGFAKAVGNGVVMPSGATVATAAVSRLNNDNSIKYKHEGYDPEDYSEGARGRGLGAAFRDLAITAGDVATEGLDYLDPRLLAVASKKLTGFGIDDANEYHQANDLYRSGVGQLQGVDAPTRAQQQERAAPKVVPPVAPDFTPVRENTNIQISPQGRSVSAPVQPLSSGIYSQDLGAGKGATKTTLRNGQTLYSGEGSPERLAQENARVSRKIAEEKQGARLIDGINEARYGNREAAAKNFAYQKEENDLAEKQAGNRNADARLALDERKFAAERSDKAAAAKSASEKAGIEDMDALVKESGYKDAEATAFTDFFRGNYAGRKHMINGKEEMVPGFENMTSAEKRAHMTNAKGMFELKKREIANTMRGKPSLGMAARAREDVIGYDDLEKNDFGLPKAFGSKEGQVGIFGKDGLIFRKTPKWLGGQGDDAVIRYLDDKGNTTSTIAKNKITGAAGPWQEGDVENYLKGLAK